MPAVDAMFAKVTLASCLVAVIATVGLMVPGEFVRFTSWHEYLLVLIVVGPYLLLGLLAWRNRRDWRTSEALLVLTLLLALLGLYLIGGASSQYRAELAARGPKMKEVYPRTVLFVVPALQWLVALLAGLAVLVQGYWRRPTTKNP